MIWLKITVKGFAMTESDILSMFEDRPSKPVALWGSRTFNDLKNSSIGKGGMVRRLSSGILLLQSSAVFQDQGLIGCWYVLMY